MENMKEEKYVVCRTSNKKSVFFVCVSEPTKWQMKCYSLLEMQKGYLEDSILDHCKIVKNWLKCKITYFSNTGMLL